MSARHRGVKGYDGTAHEAWITWRAKRRWGLRFATEHEEAMKVAFLSGFQIGRDAEKRRAEASP